MRISERRQNMLRALHAAFGLNTFGVADVTHQIAKKFNVELSDALNGLIGKGVPNLARPAATGRALQMMLLDKQLGSFMLTIVNKDVAARAFNVYQLVDCNAPPPVHPVKPAQRWKCGPDGRPIPAEPDMPAPTAPPVVDTPKPVELPKRQPGVWRQPTKAELAARHRETQAIGAFAAQHTDEWFIAACATRNRG